MVAARINGSQCFGEFSGENEQEWTNFGCRPEAFSLGGRTIKFSLLRICYYVLCNLSFYLYFNKINYKVLSVNIFLYIFNKN